MPLLKARECQRALVVELSALKIKNKREKYAFFYKICFWVSKGGCREHPGTGQTPGQVCSDQLSCISQRQGQTEPKGHLLFPGWKIHQAAASAFRGQLDTGGDWGCLAEDSSSPEGRARV